MTDIHIEIYNDGEGSLRDLVQNFVEKVDDLSFRPEHWESWMDLRLEVQNWLADHCVDQFSMYFTIKWFRGDLRNYQGPAFDLEYLVIQFNDPKDAILFKLTWL